MHKQFLFSTVAYRAFMEIDWAPDWRRFRVWERYVAQWPWTGG